jgi:ribonuclease HI
MQYEGQKYGILHPCQYGGTMQHSTQDAGIQVIHNIREAWAEGRLTSALLVDIAQFFPSLNHGLAVKVFQRQGYNSTLCGFLEHYFKDRNTRFLFNKSLTESRMAYSGAGQGSCFSPVATTLYLAPALHHAAPVQTKPTDRTHQFFVDDEFIQAFSDKMTHIKGAHDQRIAQLRQNARTLADAYGRLVTSMRMAGLELEPDKSDLIHFVKGKKPYTDAKPLGPKVYLDNQDGKPLVPIEPTDTVRYLGFYLKPNLSWHDHLRYYSVKAQSTVNALRMLGNSARGFSPYHKRRLYISNVLPILTYGAQLWWNLSWNRTKGIAKELQLTQTSAARWITEAFKMTPVGALETMAGLVPIQTQIDQLMESTIMRTRTLMRSHLIRSNLDRSQWRSNLRNVKAMFPHKHNPRRRRMVETPITIVNTRGNELTDERFDVMHRECRRGNRVIDQHERRIVLDMNRPHPAKDSNEFEAWMEGKFWPEYHQAKNDVWNDNGNILLWTDGSMVVDDDRRPVVNKAGAAYRVDTMWATRHAAKTKRMGDTTAFDAEMKALAMGLKKCNDVADKIEAGDDRHPPREVKNLVIYSDSTSAMRRMLQPDKLGASQLQAIGCCKSIRTFLEKRPNRRVILCWCPSHQDVAENEDVDRMAKLASRSDRQPQRLPTWSVAKQRIREHASEIWHRKMMDPKYMGHQALLRFDEVGKMRTKAKSHLPFKLAAGIDLTASDSSRDTNRLFARYVHFFTGHGPSGEFRLRFGHDDPWHCPCNDVARPLDTRDHALYECPLWTRDFS